MILDNWQEEALKHDGDLLLCTGRQVGKTTILARKSAEYMIKNSDSTIVCCSLTEDQAKLIIMITVDYLEKHYRAKVCTGTKKPTQNKIELTNGSKMLARPVGTTGNAIRGFTGNVLILDEVSRFNELIIEAAKPILLTTGGKIWAASTPFGKRGFFWECYQNKNKRFKVIEVNSWDVIHNREISEDWTEKRRAEAINLIEQDRKDMSAKQFGQEYLGQFLEDINQMFPDELIKSCMTLQKSGLPYQNAALGDMYAGVDVARCGGDESVITSFARIDKEKLRQIEHEVMKNTITTELTRRILAADKVYKYKKIFIDTTGLGYAVFDPLLENSQTAGKVISIENSYKSLDRDSKQKVRLLKEDLYSNLLALMEQGKVKLFDDDDLFMAFKSVQYETDEKTLRVRIFGNYTHQVEAIIRAAWCMAEKGLNLWCGYTGHGC